MFNNLLRCLAGVVLVTNIFSCRSVLEEKVEIGNRYFSYVIDRNGKNRSFVDLVSGTDYLADDSTSYCAYVKRDGSTYHPSKITMTDDQLEIRFDSAAAIAYVSFQSTQDRLIIKLDSVKGEVEAITFVNIPLKLEAVPDEPFAACVLSMNLKTHVEQLPVLQDYLWATAYKKFGLEGAEVAMIGTTQAQILPSIRTVMKSAKDIPFSDKGGAWAQQNKDGYGSYLMDFGTLTEKTVDEWIARCDSLGFNQIAIHGAHYFFKNGDLELHKDKWPGGWGDFKKINARLHQAGISSILLTYAYFIEKSSKYVSPVPSEDLGYFNAFTLDADIGPNDTEMVVKESTADVSAIVGYFIQNSATLRIGTELVEFSEVSKTPPYKFKGLKRGVNGTKASAHSTGEKSYHLQQLFGLFVPGPETELFAEIARKTAQIVNENNFDGIYFDAIDGNNMLGGKENAWHYGSKFVFETARHLKPMVGMEMCDMPHHYWHYSSRWQAWDKAVRGYKRFVDVHMAALKSEDHRHGEWIGYTGSINRLAPLQNGRLMLPLHMGWWGNHTWESPQVETTFPDDMEYLLAKMIGNDAGLSMLGGTDEKTLQEKPVFRKLVALTRKYEKLRHRGYFHEPVKEELRQPGKEFSLVDLGGGEWAFRRMTYDKQLLSGKNPEWKVTNPNESQPLRLRIQPQMSLGAFDGEGILLTDYGANSGFELDTTAKGMKAGTEPGGNAENVGATTRFQASNDGTVLQEASWVKWLRKFDPCLDLTRYQGLGVWVEGDGSGALLNLRTESPRHISMGARGDHFVKLDFTGWRYFELVEIESARFSDYLWPDEYHNVYNTYFFKVIFNCIDKLQVWFNNVPKGKQVSARLGAVKALPLKKVPVENIAVKIGTSTITFPVRMEPGMYLEFFGIDDCTLYSAEGKFLEKVKPVGEVPDLANGENLVQLKMDAIGLETPRVQVTVIANGEILKNN